MIEYTVSCCCQYEGGSPIWLRVGSSCRGSYSLRAFKLSSELFSVDLSFPPKESTFESRHSLDNCNKSENYNDVLVSLPSYVSGAIRVAVSNIKGMTVAKRIIFVKCTRRYNSSIQGNVSQVVVYIGF